MQFTQFHEVYKGIPCAQHTDSLCVLACGFCVSRNSGTGGQGAVHTAAARPCYKKGMVDTRQANFHSGCMNRHRKHYSHLIGGSFLAGKGLWALSRSLPIESAYYCIVINAWTWSRVCLLSLKLHFSPVWRQSSGRKEDVKGICEIIVIAVDEVRMQLQQAGDCTAVKQEANICTQQTCFVVK